MWSINISGTELVIVRKDEEEDLKKLVEKVEKNQNKKEILRMLFFLEIV